MAGKVIATWTPKGGIGKTTTTVNLALWLSDLASQVPLVKKLSVAEADAKTAVLAKSGKKGSTVCLVDTDGGRYAFTTLSPTENGQAIVPERNLADLLELTCKVEDILVDADFGEGRVKLIDADSRLGSIDWLTQYASQGAGGQAVKDLFKALREQFDFILVDCPYTMTVDGLNALVLKNADGILMVQSPGTYDSQAFNNGWQSLKEFLGKSFESKLLGVVMNRFKTADHAEVEMEQSKDVQITDVRGLLSKDHLFVVVPATEAQTSANKMGYPLYAYRRTIAASRKFLLAAAHIQTWATK